MIVAAILSESADAKLFKKKKKWFPKIFKPHFFGFGSSGLGLGGLGLGHGIEKTPVEFVDQPRIVEIVKHIPVIQKIEVIKPVEIIKTVNIPGEKIAEILS